MNIIHAVILGSLQGILEWFPVSSEGILTLISINFLGLATADAISFSIWLHLGTFFAALIYFRNDILALIKHFPVYIKDFNSDDEKTKLTTFLIISTIITGIVGLPIFLFALNILGGVSAKIMTSLIGIFLIFTGIIQKRSKEGMKETANLQKKDGVLLGILQGFSALPGISRSGITMSGLLFKKFNSETALKLSFLMSMPAVLVAEIGLGVLKGVDVSLNSIVSIVFSFILGLLTIDMMLKISRKIEFWKFCIALGLIAILPILL